MAEILPEVRLFTCLRNPFDRLSSVYSYRRRSGRIPPGLSLDAAVRSYSSLVSDNCYATKLKAYRRYFDPDQLLILFYDDLVAAPDRFIEELFTFIGVAPAFRPDVLHQRINASAVVRSQAVGKLANTTAGLLRRVGLFSVLDWAKRSQAVRGMVLKPLVPDTPDGALLLRESTRERLLETWTSEVKQIAQWTGRPLDHWLQ